MRAVIFDLDGVLVRTDQAHDKAWRALAGRLGIPFDGRAAARLRGVSRMEALDIVLEGCGRSFTPAEKEALAAEKNERYRALIAEMTPADVAPDTTVTLKALRERGLLLAVASSSKNARFILERTGLTPYFHAVVDGTQIARSKPDPEVFLKAAQALGVSIDDINDTLQTAWGSSYVNDFMDRGRVKKVYVQAAAKYRMLPDDINLWYVRNSSGTMVPFSAFATSRWETGSPRLERYNGYSAVEIVGEAAPGISTGTAMDMMEKLAAQLPTGFGLEWTAMSYQERLSGAQAPALYAISLLVVFLCLAALYESWSVPFSVMLVVPLGVIGALLATWVRGLENDVYFQVGLLTVIGLSAKNAILIVEFANEMNAKGHELMAATLHACRQRLRPILMTSLAFVFGVLPMATSTGAGSSSQHAVGTGVMGGMISATILAIYFVPLFFVLVRRRFPLKERPE
mgnify:FL=1